MEKYIGLTRRWEFDHRLVRFFKNYFNEKSIVTSRFSKEVLSKRLVQASYFFTLRKLSKELVPGRVEIAGIILDENSNLMDVPVRVLFHQYYRFLKYFIYNLFLLPVKSIFTKKEFGDVTVLLDMPIEKLLNEKSYSLFKKYCDEGPIKSLDENFELYITSNKYERSGRFIQSRFPFLELASTSFELRDLVPWFYENIIIFLEFTKMSLRERAFSFLNSDYASLGLVEFLNKKERLKTLIITNSSLYNQQLWITSLKNRSFSSEMIWYSANNKNLIYKGFEEQNYDSPCYDLLNVDFNWMWSETEKNWIKSFNDKRKASVVGPIIFEPLLDKTKITKGEILLTIFDIIPPSEKSIVDMLGVPMIYQNFEVLKTFINDIVEVCAEIQKEKGLKIKLLLKHKRGDRARRDLRYFDYIDDLEKEGLLEKIDINNSVFELVKKSTLVLSTPFTSPNLIADYYDIPSVYYDPEDCLVPHPLPESVFFITSRDRLRSIIQEILSENQ
jgi:polysaccharide biosynthesis PFTS motif protein